MFFFLFLPLVLELWKEERGRRTLENENIRRLQNKKETGKRTKQKPKKKRCRRRMQQRESCYADVVVSSCCFFSSEMMAVVLRRIVVLGVEGHRIGRRPMHHSRCRRRSSVHHVAHTATIRTVSAARASWIQSHCQNHNRQMQSVFN